MASGISFMEGNLVWALNVEHIVYCHFNEDASVTIQFVVGEKLRFTGMNERDKDALKRTLRISPS